MRTRVWQRSVEGGEVGGRGMQPREVSRADGVVRKGVRGGEAWWSRE